MLVSWVPHTIKVITRDKKDRIRVLLVFLLYHCYRERGPPKMLGLSSGTGLAGCHLYLNQNDGSDHVMKQQQTPEACSI